MRKMRIPQIFTLIRDLHPLANTHAEHTNKGDKQFSLLVAFCRNEATRTPDPYVPNVVRYQLRYIPIVCVVPPGIEPGTQGFSVLCSTNWAMAPTCFCNRCFSFAVAKVRKVFNLTNVFPFFFKKNHFFLLFLLITPVFSPQRPYLSSVSTGFSHSCSLYISLYIR